LIELNLIFMVVELLNMNRFQDKVCVITASATGIGLAMAEKFGLEGGKIVISSRDSKNVNAAVEKLRAQNIICEGVVCHVSKDRKKLIDFAIEKFGKIDILINNAAVSTHLGPSMETPEAAYDRMLDVNVKSCFYLVKEALPHLKKSKGVVLFISSVAAYNSLPLLGIYGMTKTALLSLTKSLSVELGSFGIRVNAVAPGIIRTKFAAAIAETEQASNNALGRVGETKDVTGPAAFLCSDEARFVTGETLMITGGVHARL
jgi:dehydrogenase/reductase SDR family protein 4